MTRDPEHDRSIDAFVEATRALDGQVVEERTAWNTTASADAVRHFAFGIGDDNPLWLDPAYAAGTRHGAPQAPPTFLTSVLYPVLHGGAVDAPLASLIGDVQYAWRRRVTHDMALRGEARQIATHESVDRRGRRLVFVRSEVHYVDGEDRHVGSAHSTMVRRAREDPVLLLDRGVERHAPEAIAEIQAAVLESHRRGAGRFDPSEILPGFVLPTRVVGPLTLGDLICWQAGIGPSYRGGPLGLRDCLAAPHASVRHPVTGWPVKFSQEHEDVDLTARRGMPAPFDNGVLRFCQVGRLVTDWMGDDGFLERLRVKMEAPVLMGDVIQFEGRLTDVRYDPEAVVVTIHLVGRNQRGDTSTKATAVVSLPEDRIAES